MRGLPPTTNPGRTTATPTPSLALLPPEIVGGLVRVAPSDRGPKVAAKERLWGCLMLRERSPGESLWEAVLPPELRELPAELAKVDAILDDERFLAPFRSRLT